MNVWFCIPSARPVDEANLILTRWREQGYKIALWRDNLNPEPICDLLLSGLYPGYAKAVNALVSEVAERDPKCEWMVTGGDDTEPDPTLRAEEIGRQCTEHFGGTWGVMQPTGDRWAGGSIDRICGSPFMGREFCQRMYQGRGPLYEGYLHMFEDEELQEVAQLLGILWQRLDLRHMHHHWMRMGNSVILPPAPPPHLQKWASPEHWNESQDLFRSRKRNGFPGFDPLPRVEEAAA